MHVFSASEELAGFGQAKFERRSPTTSQLLELLKQKADKEGFFMSLTMQEFERDYIAKRLPKLSPEDRRKACRLKSD